MSQKVNYNGYKISKPFYDMVNEEILPGLNIKKNCFWSSFTKILKEFTARNIKLLEFRELLQEKIDAWHLKQNLEQNSKQNLKQESLPFPQSKYQKFLKEIDYLVEPGEDFKIATTNVDKEVALIAGPQLVVPLMNARFALNAANARWGSLYDALYGTDVIEEDDGAEKLGSYNPLRGNKVQIYAKQFLDLSVPLNDANHNQVSKYTVINQQLAAKLESGEIVFLCEPKKFTGYCGDKLNPTTILLKNNGLHIEIQIDSNDLIGKNDLASVKDVLLESAITTIQDCEDSIAAVDTDDKIKVYRNWLGLMKGDLTETFTKAGKSITRRLNSDRNYLTPNGDSMSLSGRSLQFIRNVGHLMTTNLILDEDEKEVPEGIVDAVITSLIALHDLNRDSGLNEDQNGDLNGQSKFKNSSEGSIYIVKPKMHGPDEVKFTNDLFESIENSLGIPVNTIKMGIMDEERRTSANLKECIRQAKDRVAFINTGFLDRTGDEIHTSMLAGPMARKELMKNEKWISVYEQRNVRIGLQTGFQGKAQIGKGMWAIPDQMAAMLKEKGGHLKSGASCAWVPSPTAATLHALHYHKTNVMQVQHELLAGYSKESEIDLDDLLTIPLLRNRESLTRQDIQLELDNNVQGLLGYVVRWIDQGVGCSTVPDIHDVGRMEDRATLRISSQHICNWLQHGILNEQQVLDSLCKMALVVDKQNQQDVQYNPMAEDFDKSVAFQAAKDLIFKGKKQPSGYTEPLLHQKRIQVKRHNIND